MSLFRISIVALSAIAVAPLFADEPGGSAPKSPFQQAAKNREYLAKFKDSIAVVRYWTKKNANGEEPRFRVPYKCPNCNNTHYKDSGVSCEKGIPAEFAGFVTASDRVLMTDVMIEPEFVDHIDVECAGETIRAVEFEASQKHRALVLKTERPFANAKAISFSDGTVPDNPVYFFIVRETGETVAGFSSSNVSEFRHIVELGKDIYKGNPNTLVLDANGNAVTVALQERMEIGQENFSSPSSWEMEGAEKRFERLASLEEQFRKAVLPVYLQLEAKGKDEGGRRSFRWSSDDEVKNDVDTIARLPYSVLISDAIYADTDTPHPRMFGAFPHFIEDYVVKRNVLPLETAIQKMTSMPARRMQLKDRGTLFAGSYADVLIFDPKKIHSTASFTSPNHLGEGIERLYINGTCRVLNDRITGDPSGNVMRI